MSDDVDLREMDDTEFDAFLDGVTLTTEQALPLVVKAYREALTDVARADRAASTSKRCEGVEKSAKFKAWDFIADKGLMNEFRATGGYAATASAPADREKKEDTHA
jgi:hypothetical protein